MKDPRTKSTTQGIDGLMIEWVASAPEITSATTFEEKCSVNQRAIFRQDMMKAFADHHKNLRGAELVSGAWAGRPMRKSGEI